MRYIIVWSDLPHESRWKNDCWSSSCVDDVITNLFDMGPKGFFSSSVFVCAMVANMLPLLGGNYDNFAFYLRIYNYKKTESFLLFVFIRKYMATRNAKEIDTFVAQTGKKQIVFVFWTPGYLQCQCFNQIVFIALILPRCLSTSWSSLAYLYSLNLRGFFIQYICSNWDFVAKKEKFLSP